MSDNRSAPSRVPAAARHRLSRALTRVIRDLPAEPGAVARGSAGPESAPPDESPPKLPADRSEAASPDEPELPEPPELPELPELSGDLPDLPPVRTPESPAAGRRTSEPWRAAGSSGDRPDSGLLTRLGGSAFDPGRRGLRLLAVVAVVVVLAAGGYAWWSRPQPEPVVPLLTATGQPSPAPTRTAPVELVVAVSGMVHQPGLVRLPAGSRVADAIEAAGGLLPDADVDHLNLARKVTDGELIVVGLPPPPGDPVGPPGGDSGPGGGLVNLNTATAAELETLPGIGPALAQRIIDYRTAHGPFTSVGQLREVSGIGEVRFAELESRVTV